VKASYSLQLQKETDKEGTNMKTLSALIVGGALTLGVAMAQDAPKAATPAAPAAQTKTKVKKHHKHNKKSATAAPAVATPAAPAAAPKK
jgi:hypothetical protein